MGMKKWAKRQWEKIAPTLYRITSKKTTLCLKDLFETPEMTKFHHILCALRYLAIENYYGENDFGTQFYIKANHFPTEEAANEDVGRFKSLIKSVEEKGYDKKSYVFFDLNKVCFNGTHRLAVCCYFGIDNVPAALVRRRIKCKTVEQMKAHYDLSCEDLAILEDAYKRMRARVI